MYSRVIYSSQVAEGLSVDDIEEILETARRNNGQSDITGLMILAADSFIQLLEGPRKNIDALLSKIRSDDRHVKMEVLTRDEVDNRAFSQWAMAYSAFDGDGMKNIGGTFNMRIANEFLSFLDGTDSYLKPVFKHVMDQID